MDASHAQDLINFHKVEQYPLVLSALCVLLVIKLLESVNLVHLVGQVTSVHSVQDLPSQMERTPLGSASPVLDALHATIPTESAAYASLAINLMMKKQFVANANPNPTTRMVVMLSASNA